MTQRVLASSAIASLLALALAPAHAAHTAGEGKEACYGVAKAGQNDCASLAGKHSCAGLASADKAPDDWNSVAKGTCKSLGGMTEAEAKAALGKKS